VRLYVVCLSVCLSVAFWYRDHIGWNTSNIISRLITRTIMLAVNNDDGTVVTESDHVMYRYLSALNMRPDWLFLVLITF